ncbi:MAG: amidohydrolase, partial [Dokdonella sp.]
MTMLHRLALIAASCMFATATNAAALLLQNVNGYTLDQKGELQRFQALLIDQGKVVATGTTQALAKRAGDARVQDGEGRTLLPGLIDAHGHVMGLGYLKAGVDLSAAKSLDEALAMLKAFAQRNPDAGWIRGRGWNQEVWKLGRFPTAAELDQAVSDRPVWLSRVDGHAGWANTAAMQKAGIVSATKAPDGGRIERDDKGLPTGIFIDAAMDLVANRVPPRSAAESDAALDAALAEMASLGMTGVHDAGIDFDSYNRYRRYADAKRLTTRIYAMIGGTGEDFDRISVNGPLIGYGSDFLSVRSVKLFADGALGSRGAALLADYSDQPGNRGLLFHPQAEMTAMIGKALGKGYQTNVHAIGDRGNRVVLDSFAGAYAKHGGKQLRNRIERDGKGQPTGIFIDAAMDLVANSVPPRSAAEADAALDAALTEMASLGMTGVHDAGIDFDSYTRYRRYADANRLTTRVYAMIGGTGEDFDRISVNGPLIGYGGDFLSVRSVKLFADGALGSRGAALLADYSDQPGNRGLLFHPQAEMTAMIGKAL